MLHSPIIDYPKSPIHIRLFKLTAVINFKTPQLCIKGVKWRSQNINPTSDLPCSNQLQTAPGYFGSRTPLYTVWERASCFLGILPSSSILCHLLQSHTSASAATDYVKKTLSSWKWNLYEDVIIQWDKQVSLAPFFNSIILDSIWWYTEFQELLHSLK